MLNNPGKEIPQMISDHLDAVISVSHSAILPDVHEPQKCFKIVAIGGKKIKNKFSLRMCISSLSSSDKEFRCS